MAMPIHAFIRQYAADQPGGVIRWREAASIYVQLSPAAKMQERKGWTHYHQNVAKIMRKYFTRVEGTVGYYVLNCMLEGED
jgi:hypothetical protein